MFFKQFGGRLTKELIKQYQQSPNWENNAFQNLEPTDFSPSLASIPAMIYKQLTNTKGREPDRPIFVHSFDLAEFIAPSAKAKFIWYGHSALLMRMNGKSILIDPMLGPNTSPIAPIATKRFAQNTLLFIDQFPEIDLILISHDHYDHLDYASIQALKTKTKQFFVALGVKRHLVSWGVDPSSITEFDWWDEKVWQDITITFNPTRHFSGRGLRDRMKSLWGGWVFKTAKENIWFSGDGGYGHHFKEIGERLGPFDLAFMECGQYNTDWHPIHLFPDEAVQAAIDAKVKKAMPVHWGGFALSYYHSWTAPVEEFVKSAKEQELAYLTPPQGQIFTANSQVTNTWWLD